MVFVSYIRSQHQKLNSREYVLYLWEELEGHNNECELASNAVTDFNNHLPVLLEQFWEIAVEKLKDTDSFEEIDEELKKYLLVLIYQCITQSHELVSYKCVLFALEVYLHLLASSQSDEFYKSKLYIAVLTTLQSAIEKTSSENVVSRLLFKLRGFFVRAKLSASELEITLATLVQIIFMVTKSPLQNFEIDENPQSTLVECFLGLKELYEQETLTERKFLICTYFFNGLRKPSSVHVTPKLFNIIQCNFRMLIKKLHHHFKQDKYNTFMNAFIHVWKHSDFGYFTEAVIIMNSLKEKYYRTLVDVLNKLMLSVKVDKNLFKLSLAVVCSPPKYMPVEKIKTNNEVLLKHILLNCLAKKTEISNAAIESFAEILLSTDLEKAVIKGPITDILNCKNDINLNVVMLLKGFQSLVSKKWGTRSKNKHIFVIVVSIMLFSEEDHPEIYREVLDVLTELASPYDLKPFLSLLSETYITLNNRNYKYSALQILSIIFKMALHPMASSTEFVKYLYMSMIYPSVCKGTTINSELFINPIISDDFNYAEFFQKAHTLGIIRNDHVTKLIGRISLISESNLKLLSAIVHLTDFQELSVFADYINDHFMTICNSPNLNYFLFIYEKLCRNSSRPSQNIKNNEIMVCFVKHHLLRQSLRWNAVANAFALLKTLHDFTDLDEDFTLFKEQYDATLRDALRTRGSFLPLLYYSQLVIFGKKFPHQENLNLITDFLNLCIDHASPDFNPKLWIGCLILYTNICVIKPSLVESGLDYLKRALNSSVTAVKLAAINLTFDLCNMVTHNFEDLIRYMFKQLVYGDSVFKKTCLLKIERLIRDDYLKLDLEQFIMFVSMLSDRNVSLSDYCRQILSEHFFLSNATIITRYFVPLLVHINGYRKHPDYRLSNSSYELVQLIGSNVLNRRKIYGLLFNTLPVKNRFNIIFLLSTHILELMIKNVIKVDEGFWKLIKDSIYVFKLLSLNANEDEPGENFYKIVVGHVSKYLLQKTEYTDKSLYPEYQKEIVKGTLVLLKLLFFNDSDNVQKHIRISLFDAIVHWTHFLMPDLVHIVHVERHKEIMSYFHKFDQFYKKNAASLRYSEESFESGSVTSDDLSSCSAASLFNATEDYFTNC